MQKRKFEFENKKYEVRYWLEDNNETYKVKVFTEDGKPVNGYSYGISLEIINDEKINKYPNDLLNDLIILAENDVKEKKWENYLNVINNFKEEI